MEFTKRFGVGESQVTHQTLAMHIDSMNKFHQLHRTLTYTMSAFTQVYTEVLLLKRKELLARTSLLQKREQNSNSNLLIKNFLADYNNCIGSTTVNSIKISSFFKLRRERDKKKEGIRDKGRP